jgi:hypothetical protein
VSAVRLALLLWGGLFLVLGPLRTPGDGDLYWQRWLGDLVLQTHELPAALGRETFTATGAPWVPQEWIFSVIVALAMQHGLFLLLSIALSALPIAILASIYFRSRATSSSEAVAAVLFFAGIALLESFGVRAQVLGWAAFAAFMLFIERRDRFYFAAFPTAVIWANLHASVAIAPILVLARVAATAVDGGLRGVRAGRDTYMFPAIVLATFCTPFGWRLPLYALTLARSPIRHFIREWQPATFHDMSFTLGALPLALAIVAGGSATLARDRTRAFPAALLFIAMLFATRNIPLFAIIAAPLAAVGLDVRFPRIRRLGRKARELEPVAAVALAVAFVVSGAALVRVQQREPPKLPIAAFAALARDGRDHRVFCENFTWCSLALLHPTLRVFLDGRCDPYPTAVWRRYISAINLEIDQSDPLRGYGANAVIAQRGSRFTRALSESPGWRRTFEDASYVVFRRD